MRLGKTCDVEILFWTMTGPTMDAGAVDLKSLTVDRTERYCLPLLRALCFSYFLGVSCSCRRIIL